MGPVDPLRDSGEARHLPLTSHGGPLAKCWAKSLGETPTAVLSKFKSDDASCLSLRGGIMPVVLWDLFLRPGTDLGMPVACVTPPGGTPLHKPV